MTFRVLERIKTFVDEQSVLGTPRSAERSEPVSTTLYTCSACDLTYISTDMISCPRCQTSVDEVPSASELGFNSAEI